MMDLILGALGRAFSWQVTQFTLCFILAWRVIRPDIYKEVGARLESMVTAIDNVAKELIQVKEAVRADLAATSQRLKVMEDQHESVKSSLDLLSERVGALELSTKGEGDPCLKVKN